jgi:alpha-glucosidase
MSKQLKWWQTAVFYQIYPRSFADGDGDGIGDFQGIIDKLDYLQQLGIDAIWLSPHYPSPQFDVGYDIADYTGVEPAYGTLDDFKRFLEEAHRRGLRVILDLVLNHTSDRHPWFIESCSGRDNPKSEWYVWADGRSGGPPNNWYSTFGGSAWTYEAARDQYYYHFFFKEQPDLNWRNSEVKQALFEAIRFWLDLGVDGYRLDAIDTIFEHPDLPDHESPYTQVELYSAYQSAQTEKDRQSLGEGWEKMMAYQVRQPGIHELFQEIRLIIDEYEDRLLVGETDDVSYYGDGSNELHMTFNFPLINAPILTPPWIRQNQAERLEAIPKDAWPCNTTGNHDRPRVYDEFGDGENNEALARLNLALMLTLRGTPFLYYGEEIGMTNLMLTNLAQFRDNVSLNTYMMMVEIGGFPSEQALLQAAKFGRDQARTPMQWANAPNGGFSPQGIETWLPANPNYVKGVNVADQENDPDSLLNFYRRMLHMRRQTPALIAGDYQPLHEDMEDYLAFLRSTGQQSCLVVLNYSNKSHTLVFDVGSARTRVVFSSEPRGETAGQSVAERHLHNLVLAPFEIFIAEIGE